MKKRMDFLRAKPLPKRGKTALPEPPNAGQAPFTSRASGEFERAGEASSLSRWAVLQGTSMEAFVKAQLHCVIEYKASEAFKGELLDAFIVPFI